MLADPKSEALVTNFAGQWLQIRNLRSTPPDKNIFPNFDHTLRLAFERELNLFVGSIIREKRSVLDLLSADYTFVNERLALHYGIPNISGSHFRRVSGIDETHRGLLGKGGILLVTSHADRTSPVVRGKWILDNLLGTPPPPPPPEVPPLPDNPAAKPLAMRARMEQHRANAVCANCHKLMDPLGLAMENFDAVGAWRTEDNGEHVDASGQLADGTNIDGVIGLRNALLKHPDAVKRCFGLSGVYDMKSFMNGDYDDNFYFNNPVDYMANLSDSWTLSQLSTCNLHIATGSGPWERSDESYRLSRILAERGVRHSLDDWGEMGGHDWPYWKYQMTEYLRHV